MEIRNPVDSQFCHMFSHDYMTIPIIIGRIRFLFQHAINDKMHAYVQWFAEPGKDPETELLVCES